MKRILLMAPLKVEVDVLAAVRTSLRDRISIKTTDFSIIDSSVAWASAKDQTGGHFRNWPEYVCGLDGSGRPRFDVLALLPNPLGRATYEVVEKALALAGTGRSLSVIQSHSAGQTYFWRPVRRLERLSGDMKAWGVAIG